jgi:hypothetical protein
MEILNALALDECEMVGRPKVWVGEVSIRKKH